MMFPLALIPVIMGDFVLPFDFDSYPELNFTSSLDLH